MIYKGFRSVQDWINVFKTFKDYPWDVKIFRGINNETAQDVQIVNVTGRTPTAANVVHVFSNDYSEELLEFVGPLTDISSYGFDVKELKAVVA